MSDMNNQAVSELSPYKDIGCFTFCDFGVGIYV